MSGGFYDGGRRPIADHDPTQQIQWEIQRLAKSVGVDIAAAIAKVVDAAVEALQEQIKEIVDTIVGYVTDPSTFITDLSVWAISVPHLVEGLLNIDIIPGLNASKIISGVLSVELIPGLDVSKIVSGVFNHVFIPGLDAAKIISGTFPVSMITGLIDSGGKIITDLLSVPLSAIQGLLSGGTILTSLIPGLDAGKIISGAFNAARIPNLDAGKIASGLLNVLRIPNLDTSKITSGTFPLSMITGLIDTGGKIITDLLEVPLNVIDGLLDVGGSIFGSLIPGLDASKITSGTFAQSLIDGLPSSLAALLPISWFNIGQRAGANMVLDPTFADAGLWAAQNNNGAPSTEQTHNGNSTWKMSSPPSPSTASLFFNSRASTAHASGISEMWRCRPGDRYYIECWYYAPASNVNTGGSNSDVRITVYIRDTNGVKPDTWPILGDNQLLPVVEGSWQKISGYFTIPAGYDRFAPYFRIGAAVPEGDVFYIGSPVVREVTESQNIVAALFGSVGASLTTLLDTIIPGLDASKITSGAFPQSMLNITSIAANIVSGVLATGNIPNLNASKITAGILNLLRIPDLDTSKITSGTFPLSMITGLIDTGGKIITGLLDVPLSVIDGLLDGGGAILGSLIPGLDTSKITSGTFAQSMVNLTDIPATIVSGILDAARIPALAASKITSGIFNIARIPGLDTSKITSGTFAQSMLDIVNIPANIVSGILDVARIPGLDVSKITSGTFPQSMLNITDIPATIVSGILDAARIPNLVASKITSGTFNAARIPGLDVAKIVSGIFDVSRIPGIDTSKIISGILNPSLLPDITRDMSSDLQGAIDAGINAIKNTPGVIGQAFNEFEEALSAIPTHIFNQLGGNSVGRASQAQANQALRTLQGTINSHTTAITALQSVFDGADGFREIITFTQPQTTTYSGVGSFNYTIPSWATEVDGIYLGAGGGGMGGNNIVPIHGEGGDAGQWATETLVRGVDFPSGGAVLSGTVGAGGNGGNVNTAGGVGGPVTRSAISGGKGLITAAGGAGGNIQDTNQAGGDSPGDIVYKGHTYLGGNGGSSTAGQHGRPGGVGAGGGGGAGATWLIAWTGGDGGPGQAIFTARPPMPAAFTSMGNLIIPSFRLNTGTCSTDAQTVAASWSKVPQHADGYILIQRANSTFTNYVYLRIRYVNETTQYTIGRVVAGADQPWKTDTLAEAIPFNAFSLTSDDDYTFTVGINGAPVDSYVDAAHSSSKGASYRHGGWGSSTDGLPGSIIQFAFFDSGTPARITSANVLTSQTTNSTAAYVDLATTGPSVTLNVPGSGEVTVDISAYVIPPGNQRAMISFVMSGANSLVATDDNGAGLGAGTIIAQGTASRRLHLTDLTPGTTTFKMVYRTTGGTSTFVNREIIVEPKP